ncbi:MAG: peptidoglycan-binding protein [Mesorhizobium amorphae]|nr:MAG: peptidoglycan-binding protein [Mesorhizobium amorphae]
MNSRRSYLETVNAGRQRRSPSSIEELNRTLQALDARIRAMDTEAAHVAEPEATIPQPAESPAPPVAEAPAPQPAPEAEITHNQRGEIAELRAMLGQLAREDSVKTIGNAWSKVEARLGDLEGKISRPAASAEGEAIQSRLDQVKGALEALPTASSLASLEDRVLMLADLTEQFARQRDKMRPADMAVVEKRLEEVSRAIVASTASMQQAAGNPDAMARLEARLNGMSRQIAEINGDEPAGEMMRRLTQISERVDELGHRASLPGSEMDLLASQVSAIAARLDAMAETPDPDFLFKAIEQRFDGLADMLDRRRGDDAERSRVLFSDLERRLGEVAQRLDASSPRSEQALLSALDARFEDFARRLEEREPAMGGDKVIRKLEAQVKVLAEQLARPGTAQGAIQPDTLGPRLDKIETSLSEGRDAIVAVAREAAENAVRNLELGAGEQATIAGLTQDLRTLETLTRRSDERNGKTFEAIHDTLIKIVERLGASEDGDLTPRKIAVENAPSLDPASTASVFAEPAPAETEAEDTPDEAKRGMFSGLSRAFAGRKTAKAEETAPVQAKAADPVLDAPIGLANPANRMIEPNTGGPDLGAIMRRVRDERAQSPRGEEADTAKSDFIAAARRAAQAAAAEAEFLKRKSGPSEGKGGNRLSKLFRQRRKPVLMAAGAVMLALAGFQATHLLRETEKTASDVTAARTAPKAVAAEAVAKSAAAKADTVVAAAPAAPVAASAPVQAMAPAPAPVMAKPQAEPVAVAAAVSLPLSDSAAPLLGAVEEAPAIEVRAPADLEPVALRAAADAGDAKALFEVAARLAEGRGAAKDTEAAARAMEAAAAQGFAPAEYRLGSFYEKGTGVTRDTSAARKWYEKAAAQGNVSAMHNLAVLNAMGADGAVDNQAAARWFIEAADFGVKDSQFNLGILSAKGVGMPRDLEKSYKWFALAAGDGDADAATKRDEVAKALSPEGLKRAKERVELWKVKELDRAANAVDLPDEWRASAPTVSAEAPNVDMKAAVRTIQVILAKNGYEAGGVDGVMGERTKAAIVAFQKDNDLPATGEVDNKLVQALLAKK